MLPSGWDFRVSEKVGRGKRNAGKSHVYEERYAFFWDGNKIQLLQEPELARDDDDVLVREPFIGCFRGRRDGRATRQSDGSSRGFDFVLATVHVVFGDSHTSKQEQLKERKAEMKSLNALLSTIATACAPEKDIILCGDFNMSADQCPWVHTGTHMPLIDNPKGTQSNTARRVCILNNTPPEVLHDLCFICEFSCIKT